MCAMIQYAAAYERLIQRYTPGNQDVAERLRNLRRVIAVHKRECPACRGDYLQTNYNLRQRPNLRKPAGCVRGKTREKGVRG